MSGQYSVSSPLKRTSSGRPVNPPRWMESYHDNSPPETKASSLQSQVLKPRLMGAPIPASHSTNSHHLSCCIILMPYQRMMFVTCPRMTRPLIGYITPLNKSAFSCPDRTCKKVYEVQKKKLKHFPLILSE